MFYTLPGPLPAGGYAIVVKGINSATDAALHANLIWHPSVGNDTTLGALDSTSQPPGFHLEPWIQGNVCADALAASAGDGLILEISASGSQDFSVIATSLTIPQ